MQNSGISKVHVILRDGKWDIPSYLGCGDNHGLSISYLMLGPPYGVPYTLNQAYPYVRDNRVAIGFPDTIFCEPDAYAKSLAFQEKTDSDVVLGLFPTESPLMMDMVDVDQDGNVRGIVVKPATTNLKLTWSIAVCVRCQGFLDA